MMKKIDKLKTLDEQTVGKKLATLTSLSNEHNAHIDAHNKYIDVREQIAKISGEYLARLSSALGLETAVLREILILGCEKHIEYIEERVRKVSSQLIEVMKLE